MDLFERYNTFIFDCDGVILDSNKIKTQAFSEVLSNYSQSAVEAFISFHQSNGGVSRYEKFKHFFENIIYESYTQHDIDRLAGHFGKICREKLVKSELTIGVDAFLSKLPSNRTKLIVSGGNQLELRDVFKIKKMDHYFNDIFGSPDTKIDIIKREISKNHIELPAVFFGDSQTDYDTAMHFGFDFVFLYGYTEWHDWKSFFQDTSISIFKNFKELNCQLALEDVDK